jgi:hypothetical protein
MRNDFYIAELSPGSTPVPTIGFDYYEGMLRAGPYTTRQHAEETLEAHFAKHQGDNAEYTILQVYRKG